MGSVSKDVHYWTRRAAIAGIRGLHAMAPPIRSYSRVEFHMDTVFWLCAAHGFPLRNPRILILDEATSALDNRTEVDVQRHLDALSQGRTTLIIAHRLSTIRDADLIAVLAAGRLVELGRHDDLVRAGGPYAALLERRARDEQGPEAQPPAPDAS